MRTRKRQTTKGNICSKVLGPAKESWTTEAKIMERKDLEQSPTFCTLLSPGVICQLLVQNEKLIRLADVSQWKAEEPEELLIISWWCWDKNGIWSYHIRRRWGAKCLKRSDPNAQHKFCPWEIYRFLNCAGKNTKKPSRKAERSRKATEEFY